MSFNFSGKKILVTGAGKGIGRGIAIALAQAGARVFALSRTQSTLDTLVAEQKSIIPITLDLSNWETTRTELEKLDVMDGLVNNAGVSEQLIPCLETPKAYLNKLIDINLMSVINCSQVIGKKMVAAKRPGSIVNVSSITSINAYPEGMAYCISKAGVDMVTKSFALELGCRNIRVNSVNTSTVLTDLVKKFVDDNALIVENINKLTPMGRPLEIKEVVDPVLFLLSDHSSMITGTTQVIDGGLLSSIVV